MRTIQRLSYSHRHSSNSLRVYYVDAFLDSLEDNNARAEAMAARIGRSAYVRRYQDIHIVCVPRSVR